MLEDATKLVAPFLPRRKIDCGALVMVESELESDR
jgi:hypothetical protein